MATAPDVPQSSVTNNPAKSWKMVFLIIPVIAVAGILQYRMQSKSSDVQAAPTREMSVADGKVHVVSPHSEVDDKMWDGEVTWHAYPNAASYEVTLFRDQAEPLWTETSTEDHIRLRTEAFPRSLRMAFHINATVGYTVKAKDSSGKVIADSGEQRFYLKLPPQPGFDSILK